MTTPFLVMLLSAALACGNVALEKGDYEQAAGFFQIHLQIEPTSYEVLYGLARAQSFANQWDQALASYSSLLATYPDDPDALLGRGRLLAWRGKYALAEVDLASLTRKYPDYEDAWSALGDTYYWSGQVDALIALAGELGQSGKRDLAEHFLRQVQILDPANPAVTENLSFSSRRNGPVAVRPPLVLPDSLSYPARTNGDRFEIRTPEGWQSFYIKGVNLGAALPGRFPSQFPAAEVYSDWIEEIAAMEANSIRVYTIHPPSFYQALYDHNRAHPERPLWLIHGVWTGPLPRGNFIDSVWESEFFAEMHRVVDLLHGRAEIAPLPGHASGSYTADVSPWTLAYIIGREWEPTNVLSLLDAQPNLSSWHGDYLQVRGGNAMDVWLGKACEQIIAYETNMYRTQRPVAYTNWPTLDPLVHPTEATVEEELAIRSSRGETVPDRPLEYDNDAVGLDAVLVTATGAYPAGYFAVFHAYPYYPDFMILDEEYSRACSTLGPSHYFGYLRELKAHYPGIPVVIAEYGVPASLGVAHLQPQGAHHGGHTEQAMAAQDQRMTLEIAEAGMAGGIVFAWIDEWFKKNWLTLDFELPPDRNPLWYNRLDAEQHYGMIAMEATQPIPGADLRERLAGWHAVQPLYDSGDGSSIRTAADAAYLWLLVELGPQRSCQQLLVGFDVVRPEAGDFRWPHAAGPRLPVGVEFVLQATADTLRLWADSSQNPFRILPVGPGSDPPEPRIWQMQVSPPGLFRGRWELGFNTPYLAEPNADGVYTSLRVVTNRRRFGRDGTEFLAVGYDRGLLREGPPPDGCWERLADEGILEVRIPWLLLNITDPSSRRVLQGDFQTSTVPDIGIVMALQTPADEWVSWPPTEQGEPVTRFSWPTWQQPDWSARRRPVYNAMHQIFSGLDRHGRRTSAAELEAQPDTLSRPTAPPHQPVDPADADMAWQQGDLNEAIRLYYALLTANPEDSRALHRLALMRAWNDRHDEALELLDRLLVLQPENCEARLDRARILAWSGDLEGAITEVDGILDQHPTQVPALHARGKFQAWAGLYDASLSTYDQLLAIDPDVERIRISQAQVLAWAARFEAAAAVYDTILIANPDHSEARLGRARICAYTGRLNSSVAAYRLILTDDPHNTEALAGLARTLSWKGHLVESEASWRRALAIEAGNPTFVAGLSQNLRWQGRPAAAHEVLQQINHDSPPTDVVSAEQLWIRASLGPRATPSVALERDSDGNRMRTISLSSFWHPLPRLGLRVNIYRRNLEQNVLFHTVWGGLLSASRQFVPGWTLSGGLGASKSDGQRKDIFPAVRLSLTSPDRNSLSGTLAYAANALDATALLVENGVEIDEWTATLRGTPAASWHLRGGLSLAMFAGENRNRRLALNGQLKRRFSRTWTMGFGLRTFTFEKDLDEGYFDPDFYGISEFSLGWLQETGSWSLQWEALPGMQKVTRAGNLAGTFRASARLGYRLAPGREISLSGAFSTTGLHSFSTADPDYSYSAITAGLSWVY